MTKNEKEKIKRFVKEFIWLAVLNISAEDISQKHLKRVEDNFEFSFETFLEEEKMEITK